MTALVFRPRRKPPQHVKSAGSQTQDQTQPRRPKLRRQVTVHALATRLVATAMQRQRGAVASMGLAPRCCNADRVASSRYHAEGRETFAIDNAECSSGCEPL